MKTAEEIREEVLESMKNMGSTRMVKVGPADVREANGIKITTRLIQAAFIEDRIGGGARVMLCTGQYRCDEMDGHEFDHIANHGYAREAVTVISEAQAVKIAVVLMDADWQ